MLVKNWYKKAKILVKKIGAKKQKFWLKNWGYKSKTFSQKN